MPNAASSAASWSKDKTVVLIGTGQLARALAPALVQRGMVVRQVFGRDPLKAQSLAVSCGAQPISVWSDLEKHAALYLLCVSEWAIAELAQKIPFGPDAWVVHFSGTASLPQLAAKTGVIWPVQMFGGGEPFWGNPLLVVEAARAADQEALVALAQLLSSSVLSLTFEQRLEMHLMATWVSNFSNHLYYLAEQYLEQKGLPFQPLHSIIAQTALALQHQSPAAGQAGPAWRNSVATLDLHRSLLHPYPDLLEWYNRFSQSIAEARSQGPFTTIGKTPGQAD